MIFVCLNIAFRTLGRLVDFRITKKHSFFSLVFTLKSLIFVDKSSFFLSLFLISSWWFFGELFTSPVLIKLTFHPYFIKGIPSGFSCLDIVIQILGMLLDFLKAKNIRLVARVFFRVFYGWKHPACLDTVIQTRISIWYFSNERRPPLEVREPKWCVNSMVNERYLVCFAYVLLNLCNLVMPCALLITYYSSKSSPLWRHFLQVVTSAFSPGQTAKLQTLTSKISMKVKFSGSKILHF